MADPLAAIDDWPAANAAAVVVDAAGRTHSRGDAARPYQWASVTKLVTAIAALVAVEEGTVELAEVDLYLAHASGLGPDDRTQRLAPPKTRRIYSNAGFDVVGGLLAERAGIPANQYIHEAVLEPLAMTTASLGDRSPAHGLVGTIDDLAKLAHELLAPTLVSPATIADATTTAFPGLDGVLPGFGPQRPNDWGLGFELKDHKSPHWTGSGNSPGTFGHFGASGTFLWVDPVARLALGVLTDEPFDAWARQAWPELSDAVIGAGVGRHHVERQV